MSYKRQRGMQVLIHATLSVTSTAPAIMFLIKMRTLADQHPGESPEKGIPQEINTNRHNAEITGHQREARAPLQF